MFCHYVSTINMTQNAKTLTFQDVPQGGTVIPLTFRNLSGGVLTGLGRVAWTLALHFCSGEINIIMLNMDKLQSVSN